MRISDWSSDVCSSDLPVRYKDALALYEPARRVNAMLTPRTIAVHMWHSRLQGLRDAPPAPGSFIDEMCRRYEVDTDDTAHFRASPADRKSTRLNSSH